MADSYVFRSKIAQCMSSLTRSEQIIADYILQNQEQVCNMTALELARNTSTSPATIVRFCRSIGYDGYNDLKTSLFATMRQNSSGLSDLYPDDSIHLIKQKVLALNKYTLDAATASYDGGIFEAIATRLVKAPRVMMFGTGGSGCSVKSAYDMFLHLGIRCEYISDPIYEIITIANMDPDCIVFTICHSGRTRDTYENLKFAKERGLTTVGVVGTRKSPLDPYLDYKIVTGVPKQDYFSTTLAARINELHAVSILYSTIVLRSTNLNNRYTSDLASASEIKRLTYNRRK